jgi:hypothetical protein
MSFDDVLVVWRLAWRPEPAGRMERTQNGRCEAGKAWWRALQRADPRSRFPLRPRVAKALRFDVDTMWVTQSEAAEPIALQPTECFLMPRPRLREQASS